jgi:hypothetical protein
MGTVKKTTVATLTVLGVLFGIFVLLPILIFFIIAVVG